MSAAEALKAARSAGVLLGIDGDALTLEAAAAPPRAVLDQLARHKADVMALLRPAGGGWSALDWLAYFDGRERSAVAHGVVRAEAGVRAFACCVVEAQPESSCIGAGALRMVRRDRVVKRRHHSVRDRVRKARLVAFRMLARLAPRAAD